MCFLFLRTKGPTGSVEGSNGSTNFDVFPVDATGSDKDMLILGVMERYWPSRSTGK